MAIHSQFLMATIGVPTNNATLYTNSSGGRLAFSFWDITFVSSIAETGAGTLVAQTISLVCNGATVVSFDIEVVGVNTTTVGPTYALGGKQVQISNGNTVNLVVGGGPSHWRHSIFVTADLFASP